VCSSDLDELLCFFSVWGIYYQVTPKQKTFHPARTSTYFFPVYTHNTEKLKGIVPQITYHNQEAVASG
uniref:hypothetical protein n=1 Tax=Candidatus Electrothrix sp. TaxID=2170559 RepID=UPI004055C19F